MSVKKLLLLLSALVLATSLSFAQNDQTGTSTSSNQSTTTTTTTTKKARKSKKDATDTSTASDTSSKTSSKLDLNTATKDQLMSLPGITDADAQKIIDGRPYRAKNQLLSKGIISKDEYAKIKGQIVAHRSKTAKTNAMKTR